MHRPPASVASSSSLVLATALVLCGAIAACTETAPSPDEPDPASADLHVALEGDSDPSGMFVLDGAPAVRAAFDDAAHVARFEAEAGRPFWRAALRFDALADDPDLEVRVRRGDTWSDWQPMPVTWHEHVAYNAHLELTDGPADALELRGDIDRAELSFLLVHLVRQPRWQSLELPAPDPGDDDDARYATVEQGLGIPGFVNSRSAWGARSTGTCGSSHWPSYITIHHTVTPTNDSMTPPQRMRQMQAFHIDSRGWCDIGYHFVVSQDGRLWQGRASHERSGAHVGGHNSNNVGIAFMGNYQEDAVPQAMLDGASQLVDWLSSNYNIARNRTRLRGHREWSGQSTSCPGQHLLNRLEELLDTAPPVDPEADLPKGCRSDASYTGAFCDDEGHWAEKDIDYIEARGVTNGCSDINGKPAYCPENLANRAQTITMLARISGMPLEGHPEVFTDMGSHAWAARYANAAAAFGITNGCGSTGTTFCPAEPLSRSALAAFIVRTWHLPPATTDHFDDDAGSVFEDMHNRLAEAGLTQGCGDREYCGNNEVSRAVLAVMLARAHKLAVPAVWELPQACLAGNDWNPAFCDDDGHWAEAAIDHIAAEGITQGCGELDDKPMYCPDRVASRGAAVVMIGRATSMPTEGHPEVFTDVDASTELGRFAHAAAALGITNGCTGTGDTFCPGNALSRTAAAAFIVRAWALPPATMDYFDDDAGSVFEDIHNRLAEAGITTGCDTRAFCGEREATRAVLASFLSRALDLGLPPAWEQTDPEQPMLPIEPDPGAEPTPTTDGEGDLPAELPGPPTGQPPTDGENPQEPTVPDDSTPPTSSNSADGGCTQVAPGRDGDAPASLPWWLAAAGLLGLVVRRRRR